MHLPVRKASIVAGLATLALLAGVTFDAPAQQPQAQKGDREREALRRAQQALAKAQEERSAMQRERDEALLKLKSAAQDTDQLKRDATRARAAVGTTEATARSLRMQLEQSGAKLAEAEQSIARAGEERRTLVARVAALEAALRASEARAHERSVEVDAERERAAAAARAAREENDRGEKALVACRRDNGELAAVAYDLMDRYDRKGVWEALRQAEPVLQLKSVETQNLLQKYRDRVDAARAAVPAKR